MISVNPPAVSTARYGNLVAQVDADGNDLGGIRNVFVEVPIGTYTGWNLFSRSFFEDGFCTLQGSFIPFAHTKAERLAAGDARPSLEERYPSKDAYVAAMKKAADALVGKRYLLPDDAVRSWSRRPNAKESEARRSRVASAGTNPMNEDARARDNSAREPDRSAMRRLMVFFGIVYVVEGLGQTGGLIAQPLSYFLRKRMAGPPSRSLHS